MSDYPVPKVFVLLPALNERAALQQLIPIISQVLQAKNIPFMICVVDDGSTDGTEGMIQTLSQNYSVVCVRHERNQGYGAALKAGFRWVMDNTSPNDAVISLDADRTHLPEYLPAILTQLEAGYDVVTASYTLPGARAVGVPRMRQVMSAMVNGLLALRFHIPGAKTYSNGFRGYRIRALQRVVERYGEQWITQKDFSGGTELFIKACRCGARAGEIPFVLHYENRGGDSKINIPKTIVSYLRLLAPRVAKPPFEVIQ